MCVLVSLLCMLGELLTCSLAAAIPMWNSAHFLSGEMTVTVPLYHACSGA